MKLSEVERGSQVKSLTLSELVDFVEACQDLVGARLQEVRAADRELGLGLFISGQLVWLIFDLQPSAPLVVRLASLPVFPVKKFPPVLLFLRAHAQNRRLAQVSWLASEGRALRLVFGDSKADGGQNELASCELVAWLFPHGQNVRVAAGQKKVFWQRPRPHEPARPEFQPTQSPQGSVDGWKEKAQQWLEQRRALNGRAGKRDSITQRQKDIEKKEKALLKMQEAWAARLSVPWAELGEWLKQNQSLSVPEAWLGLVDSQKSLAENIADCFRRAREVQSKRAGYEARRQQLIEEIDHLRETQGPDDSSPPKLPGQDRPSSRRTHPDPLRVAAARGRKCVLSDDLVAYRGNSAKDNLALLRSVRPWTIWFHLRDYPGAYGFIMRHREQEVPHAALCMAARWLVEETVGRKIEPGKFVVVCAECRFVRPIKGDRLGRVTYHNEQELVVDLNKNATC